VTAALALRERVRYLDRMKLYRAFATVGGLTMASRILGFARDILIAAALGTGIVADAFFVAFRFPNLFRRLFGEGAFNAAFVPLFAKKLEGEGQPAAVSFAEEAMAGLLFVLLVLTAIAEIAMPWLMLILAPGFAADPEKYDLAVTLTQIAFPYLTCMSLVALLSGVLNSMRRFTAAAAAPILLNVVLIAAIGYALWAGYARSPAAGWVLAVGVMIAGFVQLAALWIAVSKAGISIKLRRPRWTNDMKRLVQLGVPGLLAGGITQINIVVGTVIASLQAGAVSYLYYADRLYQLPLGIVGVAIGVVLLPDLARKLRAGDEAAAIDSQNRSLEFALLLTLPAAVALTVAAQPIISVLFERGAFSALDTPKTAAALAAFSVGLPAFVMIKVFQPAFFAREDTATPMRYAGVNMVVNVVGSLGLFFLFQKLGMMPFLGIAVATSVAAWINAAMLWWRLRANGQFVADARLRRNLPVILLVSIAMGVVIANLAVLAQPFMAAGQSMAIKAAALVGLLGVGGLVFGGLIIATDVLSVAQLKRIVRRG
jgi:putative peptidoglycan lipid II flippase